MTALRFPFGIAGSGRASTATSDERIRQLIEQVMFTSLGERINRPTFGSNLGRLVFSPNSDTVSAATQLVVQGALMQWLGDLVIVQAVEVVNDDSTLRVTVQYVIRDTQEQRLLEVVERP